MTAREKNKLAGIFLMVHSGLQTCVFGFICLFYGVVGSAVFVGGSRGEDKMVGLFFIGFVVFFAVIAFLLIIPQFIGGYKLFKERPNARTWGIIGSIISCLSIPIGTAAGVFGLVFLFSEDGKQFYGLPGSARQAFPLPPSSPHGWL
ncbi:MAG: hypothetical protein ACR2IH_05540 [Pyrinomonadaceae bacterium]